MQNQKTDTTPRSTARPHGRAAHRRILIEQDGASCWELVAVGDAWFVERTGPSGVERFDYESFEASADGQRLANSLNVALARTPKG